MRKRPNLPTRRKVILGLFGASFLFMMIGVIPWADIGINAIATRYWWFAELAALFMVMAIVIGIVGAHARDGHWSTPSSTARATWWAWRWSSAWRAASR